MPGASFNVSPPPLKSPFTLDKNGVLNSEPWIAWLARITFPVLTAAYDAQTSIETLLQLGKDVPEQSGSDLQLGSRPQVARQAPDPFPPPSPHGVEGSHLALLAAARFGSQLPVWSIGDTHSNRSKYPNSSYPVDTLFLETDRLLLYRNTGAAWKYAAGQYDDTLANLPALGANDAGALFGVTDYGHVLRWSGTVWGWAPGESGSGYFQDFAVAPTGSGWHLCDGSAGIAYLKADGTTATVTLPDYATPAYRKSTKATYAAGITAAAPPTLTPTGTVASTFTGTPKAWDVVNVVSAAGTQSVLKDDGTNNPYTPAGAVASAFTGTPNQPTTLPDDPIAHHSVMTYFRQ